MFLNNFNSYVIVSINIVALVFCFLTLMVFFVKRKHVARKPYRKERGLSTVNKSLTLGVFIFINIILFFSLNHEKHKMEKELCLVLLFFECYCMLAFFSWCFNDLLIGRNILKIRIAPDLTAKQMYLIGYLVPIPFVATLVVATALKQNILSCNTTEDSSEMAANNTTTKMIQENCNIYECSISSNTSSRILASFTFLIPIAIEILLAIIQTSQLCYLLWDTWNKLNIKKSFRIRIEKFKSRHDIQRSILLIHMKLLLLFASLGVVIAEPNLKDIFQIFFTSALSATLIVIFINDCLIREKELNPFVWLESWLTSNQRVLEQSPSLATVYELTQSKIGKSPDLQRATTAI